MGLPNELVLHLVQFLDKVDLKTVRLVCKTWSQYASESLFDKLYISPREEDIKVFESVTQHPQLRRYVKELEYDSTRFQTGFSYIDYCSDLLDQLLDRRHLLPKESSEQQIKHFDPQIDAFNKLIMEQEDWFDDDAERLYEQCKDYNFIVEGYHKWQECATFQNSCIRSGDFSRIVTGGLRNLDGLDSLRVCCAWSEGPPVDGHSHQAHSYTSPFGRTWSIFRVAPKNWASEMLHFEEPENPDHGFDDFSLITTAIDLAQKRMRQLSVLAMSPILFHRKYMKGDKPRNNMDVYSNIEILDLQFEHFLRTVHKHPRTTICLEFTVFSNQRLA